MSLILEALRKSEAERRRGLAPDVAMELPPSPASRPRALGTWLLPALVVAALLVLAGWWMTREPVKTTSPDTNVEVTDTSLVKGAPVPAMTPRIEPSPAAPVVAITAAPTLQAPVLSTPPAAPPNTSTTPATTLTGDATATTAAVRPSPSQPTPTTAVPARPLPQPANDISNDASMLPPIKLSMHMWDDVPSRRFVILNGQRMAEGDHYGGITVLAIERAGVVVESNGAKARVPLP